MMQVTVKTLRHYEQKGLLIPAEVDEWTGYRYYTLAQMQKLNAIRDLQRLGFSLDEIQELYEEDSHSPSVRQISEKIEETERQLRSLIRRRNQLLDWRNARNKMNDMEKFSIQSLPEIIVASHREVIPNYEALGPLCVQTIGPEMKRIRLQCPPPGYCFTIEHCRSIARRTSTSSIANRSSRQQPTVRTSWRKGSATASSNANVCRPYPRLCA